MKTTLVREDLLKALNIANRFIPLKPSIPVLGNILFKSSKTSVEIFATNLESSVNLSLPVKSEGDWELTAPAKIFYEFVNSASGKEVTLETEKENLKISCGDLSASLAGIAASEFPTLPTTEQEGATFDLTEFQQAVNDVAFAASVDPAKPILTGVFINDTENATIVVATDGVRLAQKSLTKKHQITELILPSRTLVDALRVGAEMNQNTISLVVAKDQNQAILKSDNFQISMRLLDGVYPQFQQIIPTKFVTELSMDKEALSSAIKATAVFARDLGNVVKFSVNKEGLALSANTQQLGESSGSLPGEVNGDDLKIAFNSRYLLEGLGALKGPQVTLKFSGPLSPSILESTEHKGFFYIVMPVKAQN